MENRFYDLYLEYFHKAEATRRWNLMNDIPWDKAKKDVPDYIPYIVESFAAVELYLPDYTSQIIEMVRRSRGRAWFQANWGYEESKHSMALEEWLLRSGHRTREENMEFADRVLSNKWILGFKTPRHMMIYTMFQELATGLNYKKLRERALEAGDEALGTALSFLTKDESAHHAFFRNGTKIFMDEDRDGTLCDLAEVLANFEMPAHEIIPDWESRGQRIVAEKIFSDRIFLRHVVRPILKNLDVTRDELKELSKSSKQIDADAEDPYAETMAVAG
jgi:acyl-[acyl-carrier-protein] desaturase